MLNFKVYRPTPRPHEAKYATDVARELKKLIDQHTDGRRCSLSLKRIDERLLIAGRLALIVVKYKRKSKNSLDLAGITNAYHFVRGRSADRQAVTSLQIAKLASVGLSYGATKKQLEQKHKNFRLMVKSFRGPGNKLPLHYYELLTSLKMLCYTHEIIPWLDRSYSKDSAALLLLTHAWNMATNEAIEPSTLYHRLKSI